MRRVGRSIDSPTGARANAAPRSSRNVDDPVVPYTSSVTSAAPTATSIDGSVSRFLSPVRYSNRRPSLEPSLRMNSASRSAVPASAPPRTWPSPGARCATARNVVRICDAAAAVASPTT